MLTKDEALHLENFIIACVRQLVSRREMDVIYHEDDFKRSIHYRLRDLTEKPKRKIQVGDIYLNMENEIIRIEYIPMEKECKYVSCERDRDYSLDGKRHHILFPDKTDLDLSKRYKLTEVDEDE